MGKSLDVMNAGRCVSGTQLLLLKVGSLLPPASCNLLILRGKKKVEVVGQLDRSPARAHNTTASCGA